MIYLLVQQKNSITIQFYLPYQKYMVEYLSLLNNSIEISQIYGGIFKFNVCRSLCYLSFSFWHIFCLYAMYLDVFINRLKRIFKTFKSPCRGRKHHGYANNGDSSLY